MDAATMRAALVEIWPHLITTGDIADVVEANRTTACDWAATPGFPEPVGVLTAQSQRVYLDFEVWEWLDRTERYEYAGKMLAHIRPLTN